LFPVHFLDEGVGVGSAWFRFPEIKQFAWWQFSTFAKDSHRDVSVSKATACLGCGQLWAGFDLQQGLQLVQRYGSPEMNTKLAVMDQPPH